MPVAQYSLGNMYRSGTKINKDIILAIHWLTKSAEQGQAQAQYMLSAMYYNGTDVEKDCTK